MTRVLVTYATMAGSTADVAAAVAEELVERGLVVEVKPMAAVSGLAGYDAVVAGGPMIMGWHRAARRFVRAHRRDWSRIPLAIFVTAISLTEPPPGALYHSPVAIDENLAKPPADPGRLTFRERYSLPSHYLRPIFAAAAPAKPASVGLFGGRLEFGRLKWWAVLFVAVVIKAPAGDRRNWEAIRNWAAGLPEAMELVTADSRLAPAGTGAG